MRRISLDKLPLKPKKHADSKSRITKLDIVILVILGIFALSIIFPFWYALVISLTDKDAFAKNPIILWPTKFSFEAYITVFKNDKLMIGLRTTVFLLIVGTIYQLFFTVITGYALSREKWVGKGFVMNMIILTMFFSGGMIPTYILTRQLFPSNVAISAPLVLFIPGAIDTFNMLLMRNYFANLPKELEESAKLDGANDIQVFAKVMLPLSLPMLATIGLFFAVGQWNSWYNAMLYNQASPQWHTLQFVLRDIVTKSTGQPRPGQDPEIASQGLIMASIFFSIIPMMALYPFLQKFFTKGLVVGAIKG